MEESNTKDKDKNNIKLGKINGNEEPFPERSESPFGVTTLSSTINSESLKGIKHSGVDDGNEITSINNTLGMQVRITLKRNNAVSST